VFYRRRGLAFPHGGNFRQNSNGDFRRSFTADGQSDGSVESGKIAGADIKIQ
jgi:hypothetical protein